ncbi:MAG: amidohydrolase family protein [Paraglaciecola sp.]|uniref:amidohydrolase family protein n=1 Tax=Paraglaciecola sp. TaxID=1920173 RepID=UPI003267B0B1
MFSKNNLRLVIVISFFNTTLSQAGTTLITNVKIINHHAELENQAVDILITEEIISNIGHVNTKADRIINGKGKYLIPGLIDSHVHLEGVPGLKGDASKEQLLQHVGLSQVPKSYLYFGFTTVLDLASHTSFINQWNTQQLAPEALYCKASSILNGYPMVYAGDTTAQLSSPMAYSQLYDKNQSAQYPTDFPIKQHLPKQLVKKAKQEGAICIKAFYETGFGIRKNLAVPTQSLIRDLKRYADQENMPLFLHANSSEAYEFAIQTKVSVLAHGIWHSRGKDIVPLIQNIANQGMSVQPTFTVLDGELELFNPSFFSDKTVRAAIPSSLLHYYKSEKGQWFKQVISKGLDRSKGNNEYSKAKEQYKFPQQTHRQGVQLLLAHNANLVFGSDTPSGPIYTQFPGLNGFREIQAWVAAGVDLKTLFKSLTIRNATLLGIQNRVGSIKEGMQADLLLLNENPLDNAQAYNSIETIIINGQAVARESLAAK